VNAAYAAYAGQNESDAATGATQKVVEPAEKAATEAADSISAK
jgi:electron transport complex protein RnfG